MPELILILFKINMVLLLFAAVYHLVLGRLTFYTTNRAFLIIGIVFSTIYPFINLTDFFRRQEQVMMPNIDMNAFIRSNAVIDYWSIIIVLFYVGVVFMAIRLMIQFVSLYRVHQNSKPGIIKNLQVRILDGQVSPFSFWQTVYVNPSIHSTHELDTILAHEQIHVKEWHTLDIILAEVSVVFYWFNPGVWLMKKAIKENIEFITDARIVKKGIDKKAYQYSLLGVGSLKSSVTLVNNFNLSDLKRRIKMMNAKRSSPRKLAIYALILPILLITTLAFTSNKKEVKKQFMPLKKILAKANPFNPPANKVEIIELKVKTKPKMKLVAADTLKSTSYLISSITLVGDSAKEIPALPERVALEKDAHFKEALLRVVSGNKLTDKTFLYHNVDSISGKGNMIKTENITITIKKTGFVSPVREPNVNGTVVRGYKFTKPTDSLKFTMGKISYKMNGMPITEEELNKIVAGDIKTVTVVSRKLDGNAILITTKEKN